MFRNFIEDREEFEKLERQGSFWRCAAAISAVVAALAAICALATKLQNLKYKEKLIELSERFPNTPEQEAELEEKYASVNGRRLIRPQIAGQRKNAWRKIV